MERIKNVLFNNFEACLIFVTFSSILFVNYLVYQKMSFLNFYYLPVLLAGYYISRKAAVEYSIFCIFLVTFFCIVKPRFFGDVPGVFEPAMSLIFWGSFLMLTGYMTGTLFTQKTKSIDDLKNAYIGVLEILSKYLESADRYTKGHSVRVAKHAMDIGIAMTLPRMIIENIKAAAPLHDIGKVDVSMDLIRKASSLTEEEKKEVDTHTIKGASLLKSVGNVLQDAVPIVLLHHKTYKELKELDDKTIPEETKICAGIIAVADTYDAIITDRPYRAGKSPAAALEEIEAGSGSQFYPEIVDAFRKVFVNEIDEPENEVVALRTLKSMA
jgi:HD-GYP domain-containing protein (c-di-GMP phosphodiesterase class II)